MLRGKSTPVRNLLLQFLRAEGLETPLLEYRLMNGWAEVVGQPIAKYTGQMEIRNSILYVQIKSPSLRQNLQMIRTELVQKLNKHVGATIIQDIHFQ